MPSATIPQGSRTAGIHPGSPTYFSTLITPAPEPIGDEPLQFGAPDAAKKARHVLGFDSDPNAAKRIKAFNDHNAAFGPPAINRARLFLTDLVPCSHPHRQPLGAAMKIIPAAFEGQAVRRVYDEKTETWLFSVVDFVQVLTQQPDFQAARNYWKVLKNRLGKEGSQTVTNCNRLKLPAEDGKMRLTDVANPETLLRLVQSIPSPKAEPIKVWLAKVGYERMQEMGDPARAIDRAREIWQKHGRSEKWIQQRMTGQETRNKLTDYWATHDIKKGEEYAILTNIIHEEWSGLSVKTHKEIKGLKSHNLRDHIRNHLWHNDLCFWLRIWTAGQIGLFRIGPRGMLKAGAGSAG